MRTVPEIDHSSEAQPTQTSGFWMRQHGLQTTWRQIVFDALFGIIAPVVCVVLDPGIFHADILTGRSILARFAFFSYLEIAICIIALSFFLVTRRASPFLAAILFTGGAFSLALGVFLLPLTIPGVFVLVGLLGFTPFFTSYVFMRNARRCWSQSFRDRLPAAILAATLTFLVPAGIQFEMLRITNRAVAMLQSGTDQEATRASHMLKLVHVAINTDKIALAYERTQDQKQRERLARAFQEITGEKIEDRMIELGD